MRFEESGFSAILAVFFLAMRNPFKAYGYDRESIIIMDRMEYSECVARALDVHVSHINIIVYVIVVMRPAVVLQPVWPEKL